MLRETAAGVIRPSCRDETSRLSPALESGRRRPALAETGPNKSVNACAHPAPRGERAWKWAPGRAYVRSGQSIACPGGSRGPTAPPRDGSSHARSPRPAGALHFQNSQPEWSWRKEVAGSIHSEKRDVNGWMERDGSRATTNPTLRDDPIYLSSKADVAWHRALNQR